MGGQPKWGPIFSLILLMPPERNQAKNRPSNRNGGLFLGWHPVYVPCNLILMQSISPVVALAGSSRTHKVKSSRLIPLMMSCDVGNQSSHPYTFRMTQEPNRNRQNCFKETEPEPEPPKPFFRNRDRNCTVQRTFLLELYCCTEKPYPRGTVGTKTPKPLEPFHARTVALWVALGGCTTRNSKASWIRDNSLILWSGRPQEPRFRSLTGLNAGGTHGQHQADWNVWQIGFWRPDLPTRSCSYPQEMSCWPMFNVK